MNLTLSLQVLALYLFFLLSHALPIKPLEPLHGLAHQKRTFYSIVDIDGSSPPPLSAATTSVFRTVTHTIDDTKTLTVLPSTLKSSKKVTTSAQAITEPAAYIPIIPITTITSISTLRITTVEFKTSISTVTQHELETIRPWPSASYAKVYPAEEITALPESSSSRRFPTLSVASDTKTASATTNKRSTSLRPSMTSYQASIPTSKTDSSQLTMSTASFGTPSWNSSYRYLNNSSSTAPIPCNTAASTATANVPKILAP